VRRLVILTALILGLALGAVAAWLLARARAAAEIARLETDLQHERDSAETLEARFRSISDATLDRAVASVTERVGTAVKPIGEALEKVNTQVVALENSRRQDYGALGQSVAALTQTTSSLATALRSPNVRGHWGELQLRNAVEAAGMLKFCDFVEQTSVTTEDGRLRPDMLVRLPSGRQVVVDAKTVLEALLDAETAQDDATRQRHLERYVAGIRERVAQLSRKSYWEQFTPAPDFVIMFIPGEGLYRTAIELDPSLIEASAGQRVIIASPTTLITLLRAIAVGWREAEVAENAREIEKLGRELYDRLATMTDHLTTLGKRIDGAVQAYNQSVGSLERRVLVSARRFTEHGVGTDKTLDSPASVTSTVQPPQTLELPPRAADAA
jgi:DNA recombination protein RmuC